MLSYFPYSTFLASLHISAFNITIFVITFMQGIYNYVPETNHVPRVYSVAAFLYLRCALHVMLRRPWNMLCTFTSALSVVRVQCLIWLFFFCVSLISCFLSALFRYCLGDFEMFPVAHIMTGITFALTIHMRWISVVRFLYFKIFSASFLITFLSPGIATYINRHVPFFSPVFLFFPSFFFCFLFSHYYYNCGAIPQFSHTPSSWWRDNFPALLCVVIIVSN